MNNTDRIAEIRERAKKEYSPDDYRKLRISDIAQIRLDVKHLLDRLAEAEGKIESIHKSLDFADTQRQRSKNYTELAINNGLALGRIAVILQHEYPSLPALPEEGETK